MRLKNKRETPVGGFTYYDSQIDRWFSTDSTFNSLVDKVRDYRRANSFEVPSNLSEVIEDQICMRQPKGKCFYVGVGDQVAKVIHAVAGAVDKVAGTQLEQKARGCGGCAKRRSRLNQLSLTRKK